MRLHKMEADEMSIIIDDSGKLFTLQTDHSSYQMLVGKWGDLLHLYYGARLEPQNLSYLLDDVERHYSAYPRNSPDRTGSLDILPQEIPTVGTGDSRMPALDVVDSQGARVLNLKFDSYEIEAGKYQLPKLPAFWANDDEAETLKITLVDEIAAVKVTLLYGVLPAKDAITRSMVVENIGQDAITIHRAQSVTLDWMSGDYDLIHFPGRWAHERNLTRQPITQSRTVVTSMDGVSSARENPGILVVDPDATETAGNCYGVNLVYSGNFTGTVEQSALNQTRLTLGLGDQYLSWQLGAGESFVAPEAVLSFSDCGLTKLSQNFHDLVRKNLGHSIWQGKKRPVLVNNWEGTYFDFTGEKLLEIAKVAKDVDADLFVMDDGWFGDRSDDHRALGDWTVNEEKLGMSLAELAERMKALGLSFGIWIEPEMVSENSDLYRAHPEWALNFPGRKPVVDRDQLNLNMANPAVVDYLFEKLTAVLDSADISYVKWDMNRPITDYFSSALVRDQQGELQHRYVLGVYDLMQRLAERYPKILFEGCASGGARFDLGVLAYQPQIWTSDNNDAIDRLKIQYGTSFFYPVSSMGAHVAAVPSEQNGRMTPLQTRAHVAMAGTYGYELDMTQLADEEREAARELTAEYKAHQELTFDGDYFRLTDPFASDLVAWQIVAKDQSESLVTVVATNVVGSSPFVYLKLRGLKPDATYVVDGQSYAGSVLMNAGLRLPQPHGDYPSYRLYLHEA